MLTSLYIHIPFCKHICTYCDFHKEIATFDKKKDYITALIQEIKEHQSLFRHLETIYIGGGTPSNLQKGLMESLLQTLANVIDLSSIKEYSIEVNPDDVSIPKANLWAKYGINRISMGVQTFDPKHLKDLGRLHSPEDAYKAISILKEVGIDNINVDLIFNLPNQTIEDVRADLDIVSKLDISHLSYYSLIVEEKTILKYLIDHNQIHISDQDIEGQMFEEIREYLLQEGFEHYEISNFTKDKKYSLHNLSYWTNKDYLGLGSGAHSLQDNQRFYRPPNVRKYIEGIQEKKDLRVYYDRYEDEDYVMMGLRLIKGIHMDEFYQKFSIPLLERFPKLNKHIKEGLLEIKDKQIRFTKQGLLLGNIVFASILGE